jgi:hypothetical protein
MGSVGISGTADSVMLESSPAWTCRTGRPWGRRLGYEAVTGCSCQGYAWGGSWTPNFPLRKGYGAARAMIMLDWPTFADRRPGIDPDYAA